jgi:hypothetical protein
VKLLPRLAGLMGAGDRWWSQLPVLDITRPAVLQCSVDVTVAMTVGSMLEVHIFILLFLGGAQTNGRWRCR